jgi:hypothetical protein
MLSEGDEAAKLDAVVPSCAIKSKTMETTDAAQRFNVMCSQMKPSEPVFPYPCSLLCVKFSSSSEKKK